jgi:hypothetical protein
MVSPHYTRVQLFFPESGAYSEVGSKSVHVRTGGEWQTVEIPVPGDMASGGRLRLDPADARGIIEIAEMQVVRLDSRDPIWHSGKWADGQFSVLGTAVQLRGEGFFTVLSYGEDPILHLPVIDGITAQSALRVRMRVLIGEPVFSGFVRGVIEGCLALSPSSVTRELVSVALTSPEEAAQMLDNLWEDREALRGKLAGIPSLASSQQENTQTLQILNALRGQLTETELAVDQLERELQTCRVETSQIRSALARANTERDEARAAQKSMLASWSWRLAAPLRFAYSLFLRR